MTNSMLSAFKNAGIMARTVYMHPLMWMLMGEMLVWAWVNKLPMTFTESFTTLDEDVKAKRVSDTHRTGRAFDAIPNNADHTALWPSEKINEFITVFSKKYASIAAVNSKGQGELIVYHDAGTGLHFHVQIRREYSVNQINNGGSNA